MKRTKTITSLLVAMFLGITSMYAQNMTIKGFVSAEGEPLAGAYVVERATMNGTSTDADGRFELTVPQGTVLEVSFIGYVTQIIEVGDRSEYDIELTPEANTLEAVVAIGYGVQKKKLNTGATVQLQGDDVYRLNTANPLQAMQGQMPGVTILSKSGQPGSEMKVTIRGLGTVGNSAPLYLIDGIGGDITTINPADIESIDVLKDAASAAIYGAQAANGVVLVTTKKGKDGRAQVSFDGYYGIQTIARQAEMLNAEQYMTIMDEQALNSGNTPINWASMNSIYDAGGKLNNTDWVNEMFNDNAPTQSYNVSVTGGSKTSTYAMSIGHTAQDGIVGNSDVSSYKRYNFRINSDHNVFSFLKVGEQVSIVRRDTKGIQVGNQYNNTLRSAYNTSPLSPIYSDNNIYNSPYNDTSNSDWYNGDGNPYGSMMNTNNENKSYTITGNVYAQLEPIKNLLFKTVFGAVYNSSEYRSYSPIYQYSLYAFRTYDSVSQNANHGLSMTWTNTLSYDWNLGNHAFNALLGMESNQYSGTYLASNQAYLKDGFNSWEYAYVNNGTSADATYITGSGNPHDESRTVSYFARLGWNFNEKYMINATVRADGSSKFAAGHRYGVFPSVSAGWTLSNEDFMASTKGWLEFLKLRASWGQVGNANISNYQYLSPVTTSNTHYNFGTGEGADAQSTYWGAYPSRMANEALKWETSEQTNIGLDARFLKGTLSFSADWYLKNTKDWLVQAPIPATAGTSAPYINGGNVKNTGLELFLSYNKQITKDFYFHISANGAYNYNEVGDIPTSDGVIHGQTNQLYDNSLEFYRAQNGHAIGYFWGYKTDGLFQNGQEITDWVAAGNGILQSSVQPGDVRYVDVNHDGVIDDNDKVDLGNGLPRYTYGFNVGFEYKGFDFSVTANGAADFMIVQSYRNMTNRFANYSTAILDRWTGEGTSNRVPRVTESNINYQFSDLFTQKGDYLRISDITLGYDFAKLVKKGYLHQTRLYVQVQNAFTFTKYTGLDPEIGYGMEDNGWVSGIDLGYYPRPRTFLVGINIKF